MLEIQKHIEYCEFEKYFNKLIKKLQNKKVIIYGTGQLFQYIHKNYDLSKLNIIGISDSKYKHKDAGNEFLGYKIIHLDNIKDHNPDYVLIGTKWYFDLLLEFSNKNLKNTKIKVLPLVKLPLIKTIKEYFLQFIN